MMIWKKYFEFPFRSDDYGIYVFTGDNQTTFNWMCDLGEELRQRIISKLNGDPQENLGFTDVTRDSETILISGQEILLVRGWGYLKSCGLSPDEAIKVQDSLLDYVVETLRN